MRWLRGCICSCSQWCVCYRFLALLLNRHHVYYRLERHCSWPFLSEQSSASLTSLEPGHSPVARCVADQLHLFSLNLRIQLALQTRFHSPLSYAAPYPPRPIFTRLREATSAEVEAGAASIGGIVRERSFYKNAYAMVCLFPTNVSCLR